MVHFTVCTINKTLMKCPLHVLKSFDTQLGEVYLNANMHRMPRATKKILVPTGDWGIWGIEG